MQIVACIATGCIFASSNNTKTLTVMTTATTTPKQATVKNEVGAYKHLNGKTFEIGQSHIGGNHSLLVPKALGSLVLVDFPAKNLDLIY